MLSVKIDFATSNQIGQEPYLRHLGGQFVKRGRVARIWLLITLGAYYLLPELNKS
jgi:hypothetical protein